MSEMPRLVTPRLLLRPFVPADGPTVERLAGAREVADTTLTIPHPYPVGGGAAWIATHAEGWARRERLVLAIRERAGPDAPLGAVGLQLAMPHAHGEIGYWIGVEAWGRGYTTEAARALIAYAFATLGVHRVQGRHFTRNAASGRVLQKLGMQLEGVHRDAYRRWGRFEDVASYAVLAPEWQGGAPTLA
jgi:RimJ/RimL family protein N-acetyltransferase